VDCIGLGIPVHHIEALLPSLLDKLKPSQVVFDVGSTKLSICESIQNHPKRGQFVAAHPLAGTEYSGPSAAFEGLFQNKKNIICQEQLSSPQALEMVLELFDSLGMQTMFMGAADHDKHMAYVSHLSHISAFNLGLTVLDIEEDEKQIFNLAGTGFESTVRLAKSNPHTWAAIFSKNSKYVSEALTSYIGHLQVFKEVLDANDNETAIQLMQRSNEIKRVLDGIKLNRVKLS
jgi:prephenate dehydrogenase